MLQRFNRPSLGMFMVSLLLITLLQMMVQQVRAAAFITTSDDRAHPCQVEGGGQRDDASAERAQSLHSCCETLDCHNPACQNLCASGTAVMAPGFLLPLLRFGGDIYHTLPVVFLGAALANPPFHPPRHA